MTLFESILAIGVALGILQVAAGVAIGLWLARRRSPAAGHVQENSGGPDRERASRLAGDLKSLTDSVASSVERHSAAIASIDQRLRTETPGADAEAFNTPLTNLVVGVVGEMLGANERLQTELTQAKSELQQQSIELAQHRSEALTDPLTGLPNRRALDDHLRSRQQAWKVHRAPFCLLMLDIDHFKRFNDTHGHHAGDAVLKAFGAAVTGALRKQDVISRYGGEEFAVLLPHATLEEAQGAVRKVRSAIANLRVSFEGRQLAVTASGGLAAVQKGEATDDLVDRADKALYAAKRAGRDRVHLHDGEQIAPMASPEAAAPLPAGELRDAQQGLESETAAVREACDGLRSSMAQLLADATGPEAPMAAKSSAR